MTDQINGLPPLERARLVCPLIREAYARCGEFIYAYAIQAGENGPVKIGVTKNPAARILTLQTANAEELRGLAAWRALPGEEKAWHEEFAHARIRGEWFRPVPELLEIVHRLGGDFIDWEKP